MFKIYRCKILIEITVVKVIMSRRRNMTTLQNAMCFSFLSACGAKASNKITELRKRRTRKKQKNPGKELHSQVRIWVIFKYCIVRGFVSLLSSSTVY